jgi:type I restriction enzyme M protein
MADHYQLSNFIWQIADLLRGPYRPPQYERVMLPLTVLRRFDCVLASTKESVLTEAKRYENSTTITGNALDEKLNKIAKQRFHNRSPLDFERLKGDPDNIDKHLVSYIEGFSKNIRDIFERFEFVAEIEKMREANILYLVVSKFCEIDLHPKVVDNIQMGLLFEDLIRRFNEAANETAGDYFTPREVIRLMVDILLCPDDEVLTQPGIIRKVLDPACGTGGMLSEAQNHLRKNNQKAALWVFGQDFNPRAFAIAASDLLMKDGENSDIRFGDTLTEDRFPDDKFDYLLANPPFGVDWKKQQKFVQAERDKQGYSGRFGAGLPRVNDGSLLFLQHMISKFEPYQPEQKKSGSRLAIVFNGSPLFTGGAGSGESEIRKWVIENDWLEAIIALPEQMFYNTGIGTYIWIVTNRKEPHRKGKIQLIDARSEQFYLPMRRSLGDKRRRLGGTEEGDPDQIGEIVRLYGQFTDNDLSKIFDNADFGYNRVSIERPLRLLYQMDIDRKSRFLDAYPHLLDDIQYIDHKLGREPISNWNHVDQQITEILKQRGSRWKANELKTFKEVFTNRDPEAEPVILKQRKFSHDSNARIWGWFLNGESRHEVMFEVDTQLRDYENIPLKEDIAAYFQREVLPHLPDSWVDAESIRSAYEINFNRYFTTFKTPRALVEIDSDLKNLEEEILYLLREVTS